MMCLCSIGRSDEQAGQALEAARRTFLLNRGASHGPPFIVVYMVLHLPRMTFLVACPISRPTPKPVIVPLQILAIYLAHDRGTRLSASCCPNVASLTVGCS